MTLEQLLDRNLPVQFAVVGDQDLSQSPAGMRPQDTKTAKDRISLGMKRRVVLFDLGRGGPCRTLAGIAWRHRRLQAGGSRVAWSILPGSWTAVRQDGLAIAGNDLQAEVLDFRVCRQRGPDRHDRLFCISIVGTKVDFHQLFYDSTGLLVEPLPLLGNFCNRPGLVLQPLIHGQDEVIPLEQAVLECQVGEEHLND